ncbi:alpha/beta hydrolase [Sphingomonas faeni]|uniref:alpha/beta hydrolase n=1 Tax=Sphingomonas faeni TaxID=185950 RepID=UPI003347CD42
MPIFRALLLAAGALALPIGGARAAPVPNHLKNIVLVHGAYADGSGWRGVYDILVRDGYAVSIVSQPLTSLDDDIAATKRVLDMQKGPVVLVGHSYGGQIITDAGADPNVKALVYVAALQPDVGESVFSLAKTMELPNGDGRESADGFLYLAPEKFVANFAADVPADLAAFMKASQMPVAKLAFMQTTKVASWRSKPSYGIVATKDVALNANLERWMYKRAGAKITEIDASHAVFISNPQAVAAVIEEAARAVK